MLKTLILATFALALVAGEAESKLPASIQSAIDRAEAEVAKNRAAYDKANEKPLAAAEKAIQAELDKLTKAGKLEEAMAAKKALDGLRDSVVAKVDEAAKSGKGDLLGDKAGVIVILEGKVITEWDNSAPIKISPSPHDMSFGLQFDAPITRFWFRAKPGYGCERFSFTFDNGNPTGLVRESEITLRGAKTLVKVRATHKGSNDEFMYGPFQFKDSATGEWKDIPKSMIVTAK